MRAIYIPTAEAVLKVNQYICEQGETLSTVMIRGKRHKLCVLSWFLPICSWWNSKNRGCALFYLVKSHAFMDGNKRTGALVATTF